MKMSILKGFVVISVFVIVNSCSYTSKVSRQILSESLHQKYDVIVVPGIPFEDGKWSKLMKDRILWSIYLYEKGIARNVMYSGSAVYTPYREAEIMAMYGEKLGIPKEKIHTETLAEHSTENIYYSYKKARKMGFSSIALASDPFQTKMLHRFTRKYVGRDVAFIPIVYDSIQSRESLIEDPEIDYNKALVDTFKSLPSRKNFFERFRGTRGLDIDTTAY